MLVSRVGRGWCSVWVRGRSQGLARVAPWVPGLWPCPQNSLEFQGPSLLPPFPLASSFLFPSGGKSPVLGVPTPPKAGMLKAKPKAEGAERGGRRIRRHFRSVCPPIMASGDPSISPGLLAELPQGGTSGNVCGVQEQTPPLRPLSGCRYHAERKWKGSPISSCTPCPGLPPLF